MKTAPVELATLQFTDHGLPFSPAYQDLYHPQAGALAQARHVFLGGNGLPDRWCGRERFVVLETGFGLGNNFLATWDAWRADAQRCERLAFISVERHPLAQSNLAAVHAGGALPELASALVAAWPPLTPNLHALRFEGGRVELLLALGDLQDWLPEIVARVDAFYLDGFAPARNPAMWQPRIFKAMARIAAPGATVATWSAARAVREGLASSGFEVSLAPGIGGKRDITLARFAPAFAPRTAAGRHVPTARREHRALIVGAGLAGCAVAWALAERGWHSRIVDRHIGIASEASGNPGGLFHGIVNAQDGTHARFNRAASFEAQAAVRTAVLGHGVMGSADGLLRLEMRLRANEMAALLARLGLPAGYVQAVDAARASALAGIALKDPAWFYPGGGWVQPAGLARSFIERAEGRVQFSGGIEVEALRRAGDAWELLGADGHCIASAHTVVLANAGGALRLLGSPAWPIAPVRGQLSLLSRPGAAGTNAKPLWPTMPIAGAGYALPELHGQCVFGATSQPGEMGAEPREADHLANLAQLARILPWAEGLEAAALEARVAWRWSANDRLPVIGAVPDAAAIAAHANRLPRLDQPRFVPREPGLFVMTALGSRGITWSALGAQVLASWVTGSPSPVEASLRGSIDPARFVVQAVRRGQVVASTRDQPGG